LFYGGIILFIKVIIWKAQAHCVAKYRFLALEQLVQLGFKRLKVGPTAQCISLLKKFAFFIGT
jgi:hypothetical protein